MAAMLLGAWQWATVTANYRGNWSALYSTGAIQRLPPLAASEHLYLFANSPGYDGQFYHYVAHDPFLRSDLKSYIDDPVLRYRRILVPLLAYAFALGRTEWIDPAYELVFLIGIVLGVYWSCRLAQQAGIPAAWGLLFLLMPAISVTMDRLVVDAGLAECTVGFLYYYRSPSWKLFLVLACAALTRETGLLLILAYCAYLLSRRELRAAGIFLLSAAPAFAWYCYVASRAAGQPYTVSLVPLSAILRAVTHPAKYPAGTPFVPAVQVADYLALAGMLLALALAFYFFIRKPSDPPRIAAMLFAAMGVFLQRTDLWQNVYHFGRLETPLLLCLAAVAAERRTLRPLLPVAMMAPRIAIQFAPQVLGIVRWVA
jgi:hypothetical protein